MWDWYPRFLDFRGRRYARLRLQVGRFTHEGCGERALPLLLASERSWALNWENGSPKSVVRDFEQLAWVVRTATALTDSDVSAQAAMSLLAAIALATAIFSEGANFGRDGRSMKRNVAEEWVRMHDEIKAARQIWRDSIPKPEAGSSAYR